MRSSIITSLGNVLDVALMLWITLAAAQHLAAMTAVVWGVAAPSCVELRLGYRMLGIVMLVGAAALRIARARETISDR